MSYHIYSFEKLDVYKLARQLKMDIRKISVDFPKSERYELTSQLRRAVDSISANIAEGSGRASNFDQAHFTNISYSSALETIDHLNTAIDMKYIDQVTYEKTRIQIDEISNKLNSLYKYQLGNKETLKTKR
ncbi:four helix bundle protein [Cyclobacterium xiamenense]|uniref:four helix bundle protein n=1 Tax=Cyclobacterium xiamenense TaxID=1297121 RepID=UPI0012B7A821|nr:four helix bundle protein [Cyclobacterium xiamenense]